MIIRNYCPEDLEFILCQMDNHYSKRREDKFKLVERCDAFSCLVAEEDSNIKGFVIMEDLRDGISYYLVQINVSEKRKGIGKRLIKEVIKKIGLQKHISLCANVTNNEAIKFYEALGFKKSGYTKDYRKGQDKYWYVLDT